MAGCDLPFDKVASKPLIGAQEINGDKDTGDACDPSKTEELVTEMLGRIADKWTLLVIDALAEGELRFSRLRERVGGVSQKMLTKTLRQLERDGLVTRRIFAEVPPRVDYTLTPLGNSLGQAVCAVWIWAEEHFQDVENARRAFDKESKANSALAIRTATSKPTE